MLKQHNKTKPTNTQTMLHCLATLKYPISFFCCYSTMCHDVPPFSLSLPLSISLNLVPCSTSLTLPHMLRLRRLLTVVALFFFWSFHLCPGLCTVHKIAIVSIIPIRQAFKNEQTIVDKHALNRAHDATSSLKVVQCKNVSHPLPLVGCLAVCSVLLLRSA